MAKTLKLAVSTIVEDETRVGFSQMLMKYFKEMDYFSIYGTKESEYDPDKIVYKANLVRKGDLLPIDINISQKIFHTMRVKGANGEVKTLSRWVTDNHNGELDIHLNDGSNAHTKFVLQGTENRTDMSGDEVYMPQDYKEYNNLIIEGVSMDSDIFWIRLKKSDRISGAKPIQVPIVSIEE